MIWRNNMIKSTITSLVSKVKASKIGRKASAINKSAIKPVIKKAKKYPKTTAAIGAGAVGTGFYLYNGKRNAYEDSME